MAAKITRRVAPSSTASDVPSQAYADEAPGVRGDGRSEDERARADRHDVGGGARDGDDRDRRTGLERARRHEQPEQREREDDERERVEEHRGGAAAEVAGERLDRDVR